MDDYETLRLLEALLEALLELKNPSSKADEARFFSTLGYLQGRAAQLLAAKCQAVTR
jgi:hypothetical protein